MLGVFITVDAVLYIMYVLNYSDAVAVDVIMAKSLLVEWHVYLMHYSGVNVMYMYLYAAEVMVSHSESRDPCSKPPCWPGLPKN